MPIKKKAIYSKVFKEITPAETISTFTPPVLNNSLWHADTILCHYIKGVAVNTSISVG